MERIQEYGLEDRIIMFCPKCGSQNADETKFCRGCGADLSNVLMVAPNTPELRHRSSGKRGAASRPDTRSLSEKHIDLFSSGVRGLTIGVGFLIVSGAAFAISMRLSVMGLFFLAFAFYFLGTGVSRLVQAKGIKALTKSDEPAALSEGQTEYIKPSRSIYETDDLARQPLSVTEHTTRHLEMDPDDETFAAPKK